MPNFCVAYTGDFLNEHGAPAYGDLQLAPFAQHNIDVHFLTAQAPRPGDREYWQRFYLLEVTPEETRDLDALVVLRPWVKRPSIAAAAQRLVVIGRSGAGYDKIDVEACTEHGVALFNAPLALNHATGSLALLFMLALAKKLPQHQRLVRDGRWDLQSQTMGSEIQGRTLGIIGLGHSGRELARLAAPFEMQILAYSPHADPLWAVANHIRLVPLDELLANSDFVSLHARLTSENHRLLGAAQLALLKPTAFLINVARGELVDQPALVAALARRQIAGAALDVFEHEPLPVDDPLLSLDNVILTPHWSASTSDVFAATSRAMSEGILRAARGEVPANVVNREVLSRPAFRDKLARFADNARADR